MLYDRWRETASRSPQEVALWDLPSGRTWTFGQLAAAGEQQDPGADERCSFPTGQGAEFVLVTLAAWRTGRVLCPLETGQVAPRFSGRPPREIIHLKITSATTGEPRMVALTTEQLAADARNIVATMGLRPDWPNLGVISLAHSYGFSNLVLPLLLHGIPLLLPGSALPEVVRVAAADHKAIALASVPALWRTWHAARAIPPNVKLAISAGAPLPITLEDAVFAEQQLKIHNFYGSSECGGIAYDSSTVPRRDPCLTGAPLQDVSVSVAPDGCLVVRSRAVAENYWPEPAPNLRSGVFKTADLGEVSGGLVYLLGRATDQINVAGRKVAPETIESLLTKDPRVAACLVFGVPAEATGRGETIVACVSPSGPVVAEELKNLLGSELPGWQIPREWWFVPELDPNQRGKLSRSVWREKYLMAKRGGRAKAE